MPTAAKASAPCNPAGQGAVLHEPARSRCRRAHRPRVQRAGRGGHQAHQSLRRGDRHIGGRRLRARAGSRSPRRLRRHRRLEPPDRRGDRAGDHVDVHRGGDCARRRRGCAADPGEEGQHARGRRGGHFTAQCGGTIPRSSCGPFSAACSCSSAIRGRRPSPWRRHRSESVTRRDEAAADRGGVAGASVRLAHLRACEVEHRDLHERHPDARDRRRPDEPRRCRQVAVLKARPRPGPTC